MKYLNSNNNFLTEVWNFVLWKDFSLKFCALKWFQSKIQSDILCSEMILVWNFVLWNDFSLKFVLWNEYSLKFCVLRWFHSKIQSEILCSEMISVWNFVLWNEFRLKICAMKWIQSEILRSEILCSELEFFVPLGQRMSCTQVLTLGQHLCATLACRPLPHLWPRMIWLMGVLPLSMGGHCFFHALCKLLGANDISTCGVLSYIGCNATRQPSA